VSGFVSDVDVGSREGQKGLVCWLVIHRTIHCLFDIPRRTVPLLAACYSSTPSRHFSTL